MTRWTDGPIPLVVVVLFDLLLGRVFEADLVVLVDASVVLVAQGATSGKTRPEVNNIPQSPAFCRRSVWVQPARCAAARSMRGRATRCQAAR